MSETMKHHALGRTGVKVSQITLGCGSFGGVGSPAHLIGHGLDREASFATMDEAVALGITLFDTAHSYAGGASERFIGEWLSRQTQDVRDRILLSTKVGNVVIETGVRVDLSPSNIFAQLSLSVERVGVPRFNFCLAHDVDASTPIESTLEGFAEAMSKGLVAQIGASNVNLPQIAAALDASARLGLPRFEWIQNEYNLLQRRDERELFAFCRANELGYMPFSPLAGGRLSRKYRPGEPPPPDSRLAIRHDGRTPTAAYYAAMEKMANEAKRRRTSPGGLALAWLLGEPNVTAAVVGPARRAEHLQLAREAISIELDEAARREIGTWFDLGD